MQRKKILVQARRGTLVSVRRHILREASWQGKLRIVFFLLFPRGKLLIEVIREIIFHSQHTEVKNT